MKNIIDGILKERDRLQGIKAAVGDDWNLPNFVFYRMGYEDLIRRADAAIGGHMEAVDCIALYQEMQEFEA